jgi:hypothetical protein
MRGGVEEQEKRVRRSVHIGMKYGEENQLEVIEQTINTRKYIKNFLVKCHSCAKDPELFGDAIFKATSAGILEENIPCGCGKNFRWSIEQRRIRVIRACEDSGKVVFLGFVGEQTGSEIKIKLRCLLDGHEWSPTMNNFMKGSGCPECKRLTISKGKKLPDEIVSDNFMKSGSFKKGTLFWRSGKRDSYGRLVTWKYWCPACSIDEYVTAGVCSGVFEDDSAHLKSGVLSCRCSKHYRWTKEQREYQIAKALNGSDHYEFMSWDEDYRGASTRIIIKCKHHGIFTIPLSKFIYRGQRCSSCAEYGFNPNYPTTLYIILVEGSSYNFTGYGITRNPEERLKTHKRNLAKGGFSILNQKLFEMSGHDALSIESKIMDEFKSFPQNIEGFKKEATYANNYLKLVEFVKDTVANETSLLSQ